MISARGASALPGRFIVALVAGAWCIATFACDTSCQGSDSDFEMLDANRAQSESDGDSRDKAEPPEPIEASHSDKRCADTAESFHPMVAERAAPNVKRMLEVAREVGTPSERLNRTWWTGMPVDRCRKLVRLPEAATHCSVRHAARGRALVLRAEVREVGSADAGRSAQQQKSGRPTDRLYVIGPKDGPVALPAGGSVQFLSVAPGLRYAVYDSVPAKRAAESTHGDEDQGRGPHAHTDGFEDGRTFRVDLRSGDTCQLANCVRPVVSPQDRWVVCRSADGGISRVSLGGGSLETYQSAESLRDPDSRDAAVGDDHNRIDGRSSGRHVPGPVSFPSVDVLMAPTKSGAARTFSW